MLLLLLLLTRSCSSIARKDQQQWRTTNSLKAISNRRYPIPSSGRTLMSFFLSRMPEHQHHGQNETTSAVAVLALSSRRILLLPLSLTCCWTKLPWRGEVTTTTTTITSNPITWINQSRNFCCKRATMFQRCKEHKLLLLLNLLHLLLQHLLPMCPCTLLCSNHHHHHCPHSSSRQKKGTLLRNPSILKKTYLGSLIAMALCRSSMLTSSRCRWNRWWQQRIIAVSSGLLNQRTITTIFLPSSPPPPPPPHKNHQRAAELLMEELLRQDHHGGWQCFLPQRLEWVEPSEVSLRRLETLVYLSPEIHTLMGGMHLWKVELLHGKDPLEEPVQESIVVAALRCCLSNNRSTNNLLQQHLLLPLLLPTCTLAATTTQSSLHQVRPGSSRVWSSLVCILELSVRNGLPVVAVAGLSAAVMGGLMQVLLLVLMWSHRIQKHGRQQQHGQPRTFSRSLCMLLLRWWASILPLLTHGHCLWRNLLLPLLHHLLLLGE